MKSREIERVLKALANRRRLAIVELLLKGKEKSVGEISDAIKLSFGATSKHLLILANADIVDKEQRSTQMFYSINKLAPDLVRQILRALFPI